MHPIYKAVLTGFDIEDRLIWTSGEIQGTLAELDGALKRAIKRGFLDMTTEVVRVCISLPVLYEGHRRACQLQKTV